MKEKKDEEEDIRFDMYHFFSRTDVILVSLMILAILAYVTIIFFLGGEAI